MSFYSEQCERLEAENGRLSASLASLMEYTDGLRARIAELESVLSGHTSRCCYTRFACENRKVQVAELEAANRSLSRLLAEVEYERDEALGRHE